MRPVLIAFLVLLGLPSTALAQDDLGTAETPSETVSLEELYALADSSPRLLAAEELADADLGDVVRAGTLGNPVLGYEIWGLIWGEQTNGGSQHQIALSQTLPWPGQIDARVAAALAAHSADRARVNLARSLLRLELRRAFVSLVAAEQRIRLLDETQVAISAVAAIVRGRAEAGAGRRWDITRIETELASLASTHDAAVADRTVLSGRVALLLGRPGWLPHARGDWSDVPAGDSSSGEPADDHPARVAARRAREAAESALARERSDAIPAFELRLGTLFSTWPEGGYLYGGVAMPLPFFDQNQGAITRAERELSAARMSEDATQLELRAALGVARAALAQHERALDELDARAAGTSQLAALAEAAFRGGEISVFELLDAVRATRVLAEERLEREEAIRHAEVDVLEALLGAPPP